MTKYRIGWIEGCGEIHKVNCRDLKPSKYLSFETLEAGTPEEAGRISLSEEWDDGIPEHHTMEDAGFTVRVMPCCKGKDLPEKDYLIEVHMPEFNREE